MLMRFFEPAEDQPCYYCKRINEADESYPVRPAVFTFENYVYRCSWHSRFKCSRCGKEHHYSWFYWCPESKELVCGSCSKPRLHPVRFWDRTYAYEFFCETCKENHYDILYSEFCGTHPWQNGFLELKTAVGDSESPRPIWAPDTQRIGEPLPLEEALKLENRVFSLRRELRCYEPLTDVIPESKMNEKQTQEAWERFSDQWMSGANSESVDEGDINRRLIIDRHLTRLAGDVRGQKVLDAGCGNGYLSRRLARAGASVTGVDFSEPFIEYCNERENQDSQGITFLQASLDDLSVLEDGIFDLVVSNIVMVDVVNFQRAFQEISRVLKDDGRFIWSSTHPVFGRAGSFDIRLPSDTHRPEERYLKLVDRYYDSGGVLYNWDGHNLWQIDRTLEEYSKALMDSGFVISEIIEPKASPEDIREYPRHLAFDADRWTHFIIFECLKRP